MKKSSRSHFNDTDRRYNIRKSDLEVISMIRTEYDIRKSGMDRSRFYDMKIEIFLLVFKLLNS